MQPERAAFQGCVCMCVCLCVFFFFYIQVLPVCSNISKIQCNQDKCDSCLERQRVLKIELKAADTLVPVSAVTANTELGWMASCRMFTGNMILPAHKPAVAPTAETLLNGSERPGHFLGQWLRLCTSTAGAWVPSLLWELRSSGQKKRLIKKKKIEILHN